MLHPLPSYTLYHATPLTMLHTPYLATHPLPCDTPSPGRGVAPGRTHHDLLQERNGERDGQQHHGQGALTACASTRCRPCVCLLLCGDSLYSHTLTHPHTPSHTLTHPHTPSHLTAVQVLREHGHAMAITEPEIRVITDYEPKAFLLSYSPTCVPTHSLTYPLNNPLIHLLTHSTTYLLNNPLAQQPTCSTTYLLNNPLAQQPTCSTTY